MSKAGIRCIKKYYYIVIGIIPIIGHVLNAKCSHKNFYFNQYSLLAMLIVQLLVLKKIDIKNSVIKGELDSLGENEVKGSFQKKAMGQLHTIKGNIISVAFVLVYITTMFKVGCLEHTITGIYGGVLGAIVFYVGIQCYFKYLMLLYFSWDLRNLRIERYFFYVPALTEWIVQLAHEFSYIEKFFLVLGFMYTTIYAINIPAGTIIIDNGLSINTSAKLLFMITWIGIIIFFVVAVPVCTILSRQFIKRCIAQCKSQSIKKIEKQIAIISLNVTETDLRVLQTKLSLLKEISLSEDYPLKNMHQIWDHIYTVCLSVLTLASSCISVIEQFVVQG